MKATFCLIPNTSQCYRSYFPEVNTTYAQHCWNQNYNKCPQGHRPLHSLMFNDLYEWPWIQKPLLWEKSCTSWIKQAPTENIVCVCVRVVCAGHNQDYIYISILYRDIYTHTPLVLRLLRVLTANKIVMQYQFGMTCLCFHWDLLFSNGKTLQEF